MLAKISATTSAFGFAPEIRIHADHVRAQFGHDGLGVVDQRFVVVERDHAHLIRREPEREVADSLHPHDDLPFRPAFFEIRQRLLCLIERKHLVNHRSDAPRFEKFANLRKLAAVWMHEQK